MFYFVHQIKLETIPYVEKEVNGFIDYFQKHIEGRTSKFFESGLEDEWWQRTQILMKIMQKKLKQIQQFHYENWMDYRANLILRSKKLLLLFYDRNKQLVHFSNYKNPHHLQSQNLHSQNNIPKHKANHQIQIKRDSIQDDRNINNKIKDSVRRIKTEIVELKYSKEKKIQVTPKIQKNTKSPQVNVSKQQIQKQINRIRVKQKNKEQSSHQFALSSRANNQKNQIKNKQRVQTKIKIQQKEKQLFLEKRLKQKSQSKLKLSSKVQAPIKNTSTINLSKVHELNMSKSIQNEKETGNKEKGVKSNKMTKEEYVQHLINKNKLVSNNRTIL